MATTWTTRPALTWHGPNLASGTRVRVDPSHGPRWNWPQVEREFEVVVSLGAVSVTLFVVCAMLFFWAKFGQSVKHFDPNFASRPPLHLSSAPASHPLEHTRA